MRKNKYFYPMLLLLFSGLISLAGATMKFSGVFGWSFFRHWDIISASGHCMVYNCVV